MSFPDGTIVLAFDSKFEVEQKFSMSKDNFRRREKSFSISKKQNDVDFFSDDSHLNFFWRRKKVTMKTDFDAEKQIDVDSLFLMELRMPPATTFATTAYFLEVM